MRVALRRDADSPALRLIAYGIGVLAGLGILGYYGFRLIEAVQDGAGTSQIFAPAAMSLVGLVAAGIFVVGIVQTLRGRRTGDDAIDLLVTDEGVVGPGGLFVSLPEITGVAVAALPLGTGDDVVRRLITSTRLRSLRRPGRNMTAREYRRTERAHEREVQARTPVLVAVELADPGPVLARATTPRQGGAVVVGPGTPHVRIELIGYPGEEISVAVNALDALLGERGIVLRRA